VHSGRGGAAAAVVLVGVLTLLPPRSGHSSVLLSLLQISRVLTNYLAVVRTAFGDESQQVTDCYPKSAALLVAARGRGW
jgi:hypothetical protein